uniref:DUF4220 domain-containing protein n=1 Tax=Leersia perrieri TaxID=77586 RepID=A0A0D9XK68_9ORYZ
MARPKVISVFVNNLHLSAASVQFLAGLTTLLMLFRFVLDFVRHQSISGNMRNLILVLDAATYSLLHYSLGVMQRPSVKNSYYQVWAVLLVTLRYSVKHGRPAGVALRQTPLVDLMSSFWAANILRSHAPALLKIPVWLLWSINSARIIHGFVSSEHATASNKENMRLVTEYMRPPNSKTRPAAAAAVDPVTMAGYQYLVLGEAKQKKKVQPPDYSLELKRTKEEELITVEKIWEWSTSSDNDQMTSGSAHRRRVAELLNQCEGKVKDLCISFALYKLLRRRFFNLPLHESKLPETKKFIFQGILAPPVTVPAPPSNPSGGCCSRARGDQDDGGEDGRPVPKYSRALLIAKMELSFLNDFFFSRHALMFATGFPSMRLILSTLLLGAISYMAYAIHHFSKITQEDELGRVRVHHGVFFTWILLTLLGAKEMIEIASYVLSDWTKVLIVCKYIQRPWWLRGPVMAKLLKLLCRYSLVRRWNGKIGQHNLIFARHRRFTFAVTCLTEDIQESIFGYLSTLENQSDIKPSNKGSYVDRALKLLQESQQKDDLENAITNELKQLQGEEVHRILLWHIATCYCECHLAKKGNRAKRAALTGPFIQESKLESSQYGWTSSCTQHYITAVRLSQYCAHLLKNPPPFVPGNDVIITAVLTEVTRETCEDLKGCSSISQTFQILEAMANDQDFKGSTGKEANKVEQGSMSNEACEDAQGDKEANEDARGSITTDANQDEQGSSTGKEANDAGKGRTLLKMGSVLGQKLIDATDGNDELRWMFLEELWVGFVLHLAEFTKPSKHKIYLSRGGDFMTHLWALLSHAGLLGGSENDTDNGAVPYQEASRGEIVINN